MIFVDVLNKGANNKPFQSTTAEDKISHTRKDFKTWPQ